MASMLSKSAHGDIPTKIKLPGYGLRYDHFGDDAGAEDLAASLSAVMQWTHDVLTIRERCMLYVIDRLTDKVEWERKVNDEEVVAKWRQEAMELDWARVGIQNGDMTDDMFKYCLAELRAKAVLYETTGIIPIFDVTSCVLKSDTIIPAELKENLKKGVAILESVPDHRKDWHPGSDGKVLDLVHPSLFPLVYQRSRILPESTIGLDDCIKSIGEGEVIPEPLTTGVSATGFRAPALWSRRFQWLPCNVSFPDGENARIDSYINNLHPVDHRDLYTVIEKLINQAVPLWNIVYQCTDGSLESKQRIECSLVDYDQPASSSDDGDDHDDAYYAELEALRVYNMPEPQPFDGLYITPEAIENKFAFLGTREKKIQVIVKLANIHLTPEKPDYEGGSWHIEGQLNEHIVATALYYYDNHNVTDSYLSFRTKVDAESFCSELCYEQGDNFGINKIFGVENDGDNIQELGSVLTREDRLIAFPNGFQHRVGSFRLADPEKPGHRKIVALFLVAPTIPIISTANVPPQQREWWLREVKAGQSKVGNLPAELVDMIGEEVQDFPIGLDEAKRLREELMAERGKLDKDVERTMADWSFSFCEH